MNRSRIASRSSTDGVSPGAFEVVARVERLLPGDLIVRVAEQAQRPFGGLQRADRVELVEDVRIFVERRAMTDLDQVVDAKRPLGHRSEPVPVIRRQRFEGPERGALGDDVEPIGLFEAASDLVVIAAHHRNRDRAPARDR